ncbi:MAG: SDR family oxidoreductase [Thermoguttaceae bacterium]|nr:SDR family oxidoreductase [Thermoguttaceae bacterium]
MARTILITGASTGIGAATALRLASDNDIVIHYNRSEEAARQVAQQVQQRGGRPLMVRADLSSQAGCQALAQAVAQQYGKLDVLVNNAGGLIERSPARQIRWELLEEIFRLNTFSAMYLTSLCIPLLEKGQDPSIVNITSIAIRHGAPTATIYAAAKGALDVFTRGLAKELAPTIRVNAVAPGVIDTPFHQKYTTPERLAQFRAQTPLGRLGLADEIAQAIQFCIENRFLTGETIDVNGGLFMR